MPTPRAARLESACSLLRRARAWPILALVACSASPASSSPPSGVFTRTDAGADTSTKVWLAFDAAHGVGARKQVVTKSGNPDVVGVTCFTYRADGTSLTMTLGNTIASSNGASTTTQGNGRIVNAKASMTADGATLDADQVLEEGHFSYARDAATPAADVMHGC